MQVFAKFEKREASLTTVESYSVECIKALGEPTVQEFAIMMGISAPNAAYKVNALMEKGYIEKIQDENDHREFHLRPTKKFWDYYEVSYRYVEKVEERCRQRFSNQHRCGRGNGIKDKARGKAKRKRLTANPQNRRGFAVYFIFSNGCNFLALPLFSVLI